ncbi:PFS domain-containing protein [Botrytis cinerea]
MIEKGNLNLMERCLKLDSCPDLSERGFWGMTALHLAASLGHNNMVKNLLEAKEPPRCWDMNTMDPLMCAKKRNPQQLQQGVWGRTVLHWAAEAGEDLSAYIMEESISSIIDALDDLGCTALHLAVLSGSLSTVQQLLSAHAQADLVDTLGQTPQHYAAEQPDVNILKAIIAAGADINAQDKWSRTPLHLAVEKGHVASVDELMHAGAKLSTDYAKNHPLHIAVTMGKTKESVLY